MLDDKIILGDNIGVKLIFSDSASCFKIVVIKNGRCVEISDDEIANGISCEYIPELVDILSSATDYIKTAEAK